MTGSNATFNYQLSGNESVLIVNLSGFLDQDAISSIENLRTEVLSRANLHCVILNFAQIELISTEVVPLLAQLQKAIREKPTELRMCSLKMNVKEKLTRAGILRANELAEDSKDAIQSLFGIKPRAA